MDNKQPASDSDPVARRSKPALLKTELSSCSALLQVSCMNFRLGIVPQVGRGTERGNHGRRIEGSAREATYSFFLTKISPRAVSPALFANVFKTESTTSLFSRRKLVTPAALLSGSLYCRVRYRTLVLMKAAG